MHGNTGPSRTNGEPEQGHQRCYMFFNIKRDIFKSKLHTPASWHFDISVTYPQGFPIFITRDSEVIMFSPCVFVCVCVCLCGCLCLSRCLSGRFNYEGLVPHKQYFAGTLLGMSSCASYVSRTHDVIDDVTRSQSRSNFEIDSSVNIWATASIKSSKCRKCSWLSFWHIQLPV